MKFRRWTVGFRTPLEDRTMQSFAAALARARGTREQRFLFRFNARRFAARVEKVMAEHGFEVETRVFTR